MFTFKVFLSLSRLPWNPRKTLAILSHPGLWGSPLLKPPPLPLPPDASFCTTVTARLHTELFHFPFYSLPNNTPILLYINAPNNTYDHVLIFFFPCAPMCLLAVNAKTFSPECHLHCDPRAAADQAACSPHSPSSLSSFQVRSKANKAKGQAKGAWEV